MRIFVLALPDGVLGLNDDERKRIGCLAKIKFDAIICPGYILNSSFGQVRKLLLGEREVASYAITQLGKIEDSRVRMDSWERALWVSTQKESARTYIEARANDCLANLREDLRNLSPNIVLLLGYCPMVQAVTRILFPVEGKGKYSNISLFVPKALQGFSFDVTLGNRPKKIPDVASNLEYFV